MAHCRWPINAADVNLHFSQEKCRISNEALEVEGTAAAVNQEVEKGMEERRPPELIREGEAKTGVHRKSNGLHRLRVRIVFSHFTNIEWELQEH
jgi:hypothetical protein